MTGDPAAAHLPLGIAPRIGLLLSGGLDSSILLGHLLHRGREVQPFYIRSHHVWQEVELAFVRRFLAAMQSRLLRELQVFELPVSDLYGEHWSITGRAPPDAESPDEAMFLPGRNALLLLKPAIWCQLHGIEELALAPLGTSPFADASADFFRSFQESLSYLGERTVRIVHPFAALNKSQVMELGRRFPLELTFSCIAPLGELHCGRCNKCAERKAAFARMPWPDPTEYAFPVLITPTSIADTTLDVPG